MPGQHWGERGAEPSRRENAIVGVSCTFLAVLQYGGLLLLLAGFLGAETCTVIRVSDGDTLPATCSEITRTIRISSIDAPELGQPYGPEAKQATTDFGTHEK
jgi:endonuclease YncB( thermonuclease family)